MKWNGSSAMELWNGLSAMEVNWNGLCAMEYYWNGWTSNDSRFLFLSNIFEL
jgi:hypothetical protein